MGTASRAVRGRHWDRVYEAKGPEQVSWFQPEPTLTLELIDGLRLSLTCPIIDVGGGTSRLVDRLLERGHTDVTVLDVSAHALRVAQERLADHAHIVHWEVADVLDWTPTRPFGLWHDRAVFHFLTEPADRACYRTLATTGVVPGGYLIVATFAPDGPDECSGLPVARYDPQQLVDEFGDGFTMVAARREDHHTPTGDVHPFTWLLMRRM